MSPEVSQGLIGTVSYDIDGLAGASPFLNVRCCSGQMERVYDHASQHSACTAPLTHLVANQNGFRPLIYLTEVWAFEIVAHTFTALRFQSLPFLCRTCRRNVRLAERSGQSRDLIQSHTGHTISHWCVSAHFVLWNRLTTVPNLAVGLGKPDCFSLQPSRA